MRKAKRRVDSDETELFEDIDFEGEHLIDATQHVVTGADKSRERPARQRVELRTEEKWLKQQLSDWDDFDQGLNGTRKD